MDIQVIIVTLIIFAALVYVAQMLWRKAKSASKNSSCASDCGCDARKISN
jgi:NADH:ubiquinone oxidoreductase subunit 3 (subunit A)